MKKILIFIFVGIAVTCMAAYSIRTTGKSSSLQEFNAELLADMWDEPADTDTAVVDTSSTGGDNDTLPPCCVTCTGLYCGSFVPPGQTDHYPVYYAK